MTFTGDSLVGGFIGSVEDGGKVTDCSVENAQGLKIKGANYVGGFIGYAFGTAISNVSVSADLTCTVKHCGGIVGYLTSAATVSNVKYNGDISGTENTGGIIGLADGDIALTTCYAKGKISTTDDNTGGIIGCVSCVKSIDKCSYFGDITGADNVGGIIGSTYAKYPEVTFYLSTSYYTNTKTYSYTYEVPDNIILNSDVSKLKKYISIKNCTSISNIKGKNFIGGLVGCDKGFNLSSYSINQNGNDQNGILGDGKHYYYLWCSYGTQSYSLSSYTYSYRYFSPEIIGKYINFLLISTFSDSYFSGNIVGDDYVGGIAGYNYNGTIDKCYVNASYIKGKNNVGGLVGEESGSTLTNNFSICSTVSAATDGVGRIYGNGSTTAKTDVANTALVTSKVFRQGVEQTISDNEGSQGTSIGSSMLKLKATYVTKGWNMEDNWNILETESYPYKTYQAAPPVISSKLVSQSTQISGSSLAGGTVYLLYDDNAPVSTTCTGNNWSFATTPLQSGATVQLYALADGLAPSYLTYATVGYPGSGTEADPYRVYTAEDLQGAYRKGYFKLMNDIDLTEWINKNNPQGGWISVGRNSGDASNFNGDGHKITGLWTNTTDDYTGLFSNFSSGTIRNLTVEVAKGKKVKGGSYVGIIIGRNANGTILNCNAKGDVEGNSYVGGVIGISDHNSVTSVTFDGALTSSASNAEIGGICGKATETTLTSARAYTTLNTSGSSAHVGGIAGSIISGSVSKSNCEASITATGSDNSVGGIAGYSEASISTSVTTGMVSAKGDNSYVGGIAGYAKSPIADSYTTASLVGTLYSGGICGYTFSTIDKCYSRSEINGVRYGGGVVAQLDGAEAAVTNSIAANNILSLSDQASWGSRVIGGFKNGAAEPDNSNYALSTMQVSLNNVPQKKTDNTVEGIAKTESELQASDTYMNLGWDFSKTWSIDEGKMYPYLLWEVDVNPVTEITFNSTSLIIAQGKTATIEATVMPLGATNKRLAWSTSNAQVATVAEGVVTAVGTGEATITATSTDGSNITATCKVTVVANHDTAIAQLQKLVDDAQSLYDNSTEGDNIGQYQAGARAALISVIRSVKAKISSTMSDELITECVDDINKAVSDFKAKQITAGEDTDVSSYANILYFDKTEVSAGSQAVLMLKMNNELNAVGYQCDLYLPDGVEVATYKDEDGNDKYKIELSTDRTTEKKSNIFDSALQKDGSIRILCASTKNYEISGNEGNVAKITLNISQDIDEGEYPVILKNIVITDRISTRAAVDYVKSTLKVSSYTLGDVDNNGNIDIADLSGIVAYIMGEPPVVFNEKAADITCDGVIDVADIPKEVNLILYGTQANSQNFAPSLTSDVAISSVGATDLTMDRGNECTVDIKMTGSNNFSAYQFDIALPEGVHVKTLNGQPCVTLRHDNSVQQLPDIFVSRVMENGKLRILGASSTGKMIKVADGCLARVTLVADNDAIYGIYTADIDNIVLASDRNSVRPNLSTFNININGTNSINGISADETSGDVYDTAGRLVHRNGSVKKLNKGVYIINGKKIVK